MNDKYLEVTNMGGSPYDLAAEGVYAYLFANERADDPAANKASLGQALSGTIAPLTSMLFKNGLAEVPAYALTEGQGVNFCGFNGDDLVVLSTASDGLTNTGSAWNERIDVVGDGTNWGQDISYSRNTEVVTPNTHFTPAEWTSIDLSSVNNAPATTSEYLSFHVSVLPVQLVYFRIQEKANGVAVEFAVSAERNNAYFAIERSKLGADFAEIGRIIGRGNSEQEAHYRYVDEIPEEGWSFYRLRQVDQDGQQHIYGPLSTYRKKTGALLRVGPTLMTDQVVLARVDDLERLPIVLSNGQGQTLLHMTLPANVEHIVLDVSAYPTGIYWLRWPEGERWQTKKLIKQ